MPVFEHHNIDVMLKRSSCRGDDVIAVAVDFLATSQNLFVTKFNLRIRQKICFTWEEAEVASLNRQEWRRSVAQYIH